MTTIECKLADGKTLETFGALLEKRRRILGESLQDALIACAIDALNSLRAATKTAINKKTFKPGIESTGWYGGFSNSQKKPCIRQGRGPHATKVDIGSTRVKWLTRGVKRQRQRVFKVTPESEEVRPYYVVCESKAVAKAFEKKCALHRIAQRGDLAKNALGVAMSKLSTRNVALGGSSACQNAASSLAVVMKSETEVAVTDTLGYSVAALRKGAADVTTSLKKAANKIAGRLAREVALRGLTENVKTPFPEVRQRRAK